MHQRLFESCVDLVQVQPKAAPKFDDPFLEVKPNDSYGCG